MLLANSTDTAFEMAIYKTFGALLLSPFLAEHLYKILILSALRVSQAKALL